MSFSHTSIRRISRDDYKNCDYNVVQKKSVQSSLTTDNYEKDIKLSALMEELHVLRGDIESLEYDKMSLERRCIDLSAENTRFRLHNKDLHMENKHQQETIQTLKAELIKFVLQNENLTRIITSDVSNSHSNVDLIMSHKNDRNTCLPSSPPPSTEYDLKIGRHTPRWYHDTLHTTTTYHIAEDRELKNQTENFLNQNKLTKPYKQKNLHKSLKDVINSPGLCRASLPIHTFDKNGKSNRQGQNVDGISQPIAINFGLGVPSEDDEPEIILKVLDSSSEKMNSHFNQIDEPFDNTNRSSLSTQMILNQTVRDTEEYNEMIHSKYKFDTQAENRRLDIKAASMLVRVPNLCDSDHGGNYDAVPHREFYKDQILQYVRENKKTEDQNINNNNNNNKRTSFNKSIISGVASEWFPLIDESDTVPQDQDMQSQQDKFSTATKNLTRRRSVTFAFKS